MKNKLGLKKRIALELFRELHRDKVRKHELRTLFWECTLRCNLHCRHCGSDCKAVAGIKDMPAEDFLRVVDSITPQVNPNTVMIVFSGGEALMRRDLEVCGYQLYKRGYPWGLVTNGMLLDAVRFESLLQAGLHSITVSLDGFPEVHNEMRGHPDSFDRAMNAIRLISREQEVVYDVVTCVTPRNYPSLREFRDFLIGEGVKHWRIFTVFPVGRAVTDSELQITDAEFMDLLEFIRETRQGGKITLSYGCEGFLGGYEMEVRNQFYNCHAGVSTASIRIDGAISGCTSIRTNFSQGNIYQDDFMEIWNNRFEKFRNREWARKGICAACSMFRYCEGNGMHLRDGQENLLICHYQRLQNVGNDNCCP